jgi:hypothetical protein
VTASQGIEIFVAVTGALIGLSHVLRPHDWADAFRRLHQAGRAGAFVNGAFTLVPGAAILACHASWRGPGAVITAFGWLLAIKACGCFLAPDKALRSMENGARSPRGFVIAGVLMLAISAWAAFCATRPST